MNRRQVVDSTCLYDLFHNRMFGFFCHCIFLSVVGFVVSYFSGLEYDRALENQQTTLQEDIQMAAEIEFYSGLST